MLIRRKSMISGRMNAMEIDVTEAQLNAWLGGMLIQHAMPICLPMSVSSSRQVSPLTNGMKPSLSMMRCDNATLCLSQDIQFQL